ncbi:MAG: methylated-DNA--[protein]-cysteine S-methyltransferase [Spirochaetes bacterium]|nr:methylated-DNA--[protein]-cysteine S-methyltransferase [Spirochaetota bacterium]
MSIFYKIFLTAWGWAGVAFTQDILLQFVLPQKNKKKILTRLEGKPFRGKSPFLKRLIRDIKAYFNGKRTDFKGYKLDMSLFTEKQKKVMDTLRHIRYGQVITYERLARRSGFPRSARFIGNTMSKNIFPLIIPCHRVIRSDGTSGGFSAGLSYKERMIKLEQCKEKIDFGSK